MRGADVLEVGSLDINGSVRTAVEARHPRSYLGVDIEMGPSVDEICNVYDLEKRFGTSAYDLVICTEVVEHVRDWHSALTNITAVLRPGGTLFLTTRSYGFPIHGYPNDYWRYEPADLRQIFASFDDVLIEPDPAEPGVFVRAKRPNLSSSVSIPSIELYSMLKERRVAGVRRRDELVFQLRSLVLKHGPWLRGPYRLLFRRSSKPLAERPRVKP